jgi:hypothetical protein
MPYNAGTGQFFTQIDCKRLTPGIDEFLYVNLLMGGGGGMKNPTRVDRMGSRKLF